MAGLTAPTVGIGQEKAKKGDMPAANVSIEGTKGAITRTMEQKHLKNYICNEM
jgi:hypothetical protein